MAYAYCMLLDTVGQQIEAGEQKSKSTATPVTQAATKPNSEPKPATKPDSEPQTIAVAPTTEGRKHTFKTDQPVDDDDLGK